MGARAGSPALNEIFRGWHSRGYIPHFDEPDLVQSISFRLCDSIPEHVIAEWRDELQTTEKTYTDEERKNILLERTNEYKDAGHGKCYLKYKKIAKIVQDSILYFDGQRYKLIDWCIMPNHVHVLITENNCFSLSGIVHSWKSFTAKKANIELRRTGDFWAPDYFDRFIRNEKHFAVASTYIRGNPVKCGLVENAEEWEWSSARVRAMSLY